MKNIVDPHIWPAIALLIGAIITALLLAVQHWFPTLTRLTRIQAYICGTVALWIGFAVWRVLIGDAPTQAALFNVETKSNEEVSRE